MEDDFVASRLFTISTVSPCHRVTVSPCHRVTVSPCHSVTRSPGVFARAPTDPANPTILPVPARQVPAHTAGSADDTRVSAEPIDDVTGERCQAREWHDQSFGIAIDQGSKEDTANRNSGSEDPGHDRRGDHRIKRGRTHAVTRLPRHLVTGSSHHQQPQTSHQRQPQRDRLKGLLVDTCHESPPE